ncbi:MAG: prepilin-type N-terminal cleavage/methylation domain-containing protein [Planctomycetes bacterium]|nr:prepilin-type N-terminal cleavage/methylation domain-containing protein [Planctomycetota bacterium]
MTTCERAPGGFTLIEMVIVLAVVGILVGTAMPLAGAIIDAERRDRVRGDLREIAESLEEHYFDHAAFPATLSTPGFFGVYLQRGVADEAILDPWGGGAEYRMTSDPVTNTVSVWSRGENGTDDGVLNEDFVVTVTGAVPGMRKTRMRMDVIVEALAAFLESGGTLTGTWSTDRAALGLGAEFESDGCGVAFALDAASLVLRSAGPDRVLGSGDDLTN